MAVTVFYVDVAPLMPALHSVWFVIHIVAAAIVRRGVQHRRDRGRALPDPAPRRGAGARPRLPGADARPRPRSTGSRYRFHAFAFPLWTFTIAAGAIWAEYAWGRFWGWDPKETWSLVTWVVYAAYLHARVTAGWKGARAAVVWR